MPCGKLCLHHHCQRLNYGDGEECSIAHHDSLESGPFSRPAMPRWGGAVLLPRCCREACVGNKIRDCSTTLCVADQTNLRLSPNSFKTDQICRPRYHRCLAKAAVLTTPHLPGRSPDSAAVPPRDLPM